MATSSAKFQKLTAFESTFHEVKKFQKPPESLSTNGDTMSYVEQVDHANKHINKLTGKHLVSDLMSSGVN